MNVIDKIYNAIDTNFPTLMVSYQRVRYGDKKPEIVSYFLNRNIKFHNKYCVFRLEFPGRSLFSTALSYIFMYEWAVHKGYTPIMDLEYAYVFQQKELGEDNKWEYCFEQPISIKEIRQQKYVLIRHTGTVNSWMEKTCLDINGKKDDISIHVTERNWRNYYANINKYVKKCWTFREELLEEFENKYGNKLKNVNGIIGVFLRENFSKDFYESLSDKEKKIWDRHPRRSEERRVGKECL